MEGRREGGEQELWKIEAEGLSFFSRVCPLSSSESAQHLLCFVLYKAATVKTLSAVLFFSLIPRHKMVSFSQACLSLTSLRLTHSFQLHDYCLRHFNSCQSLLAYSVSDTRQCFNLLSYLIFPSFLGGRIMTLVTQIQKLKPKKGKSLRRPRGV